MAEDEEATVSVSHDRILAVRNLVAAEKRAMAEGDRLDDAQVMDITAQYFEVLKRDPVVRSIFSSHRTVGRDVVTMLRHMVVCLVAERDQAINDKMAFVHHAWKRQDEKPLDWLARVLKKGKK